MGLDLSASFVNDIDGALRPVGPAWDSGADEFGGDDGGHAPVVRRRRASDSAVELTWRTASELDNLGFHLYRSQSAVGPVDADHVVPDSGPRLVPDRGDLLAARHGAPERDALLLPARGRGHGVGIDVPRPGLGGAAGGSGSGSGENGWSRRVQAAGV